VIHGQPLFSVAPVGLEGNRHLGQDGDMPCNSAGAAPPSSPQFQAISFLFSLFHYFSSNFTNHFQTPSTFVFSSPFGFTMSLKSVIKLEAFPLYSKNLDGVLLSTSLSLVVSVSSGKCQKF